MTSTGSPASASWFTLQQIHSARLRDEALDFHLSSDAGPSGTASPTGSRAAAGRRG
ncbi:MAG TPA: hypothetical protein VFX70_08250 [Mycobacteriales bacterium]|nr:hypothetical protein [Mycobacteriales bacterium]